MAKKRAKKKTPGTKSGKKKTPHKRATKTKRPRSKSIEPLRPEPGEVIIRMYRQGLGDCFLLAFGTKNDPRYVLIDCGVHMRQTDGSRRLLQVMQHLAEATGNHLHVVVATHEHADHLSGFVQKGSPFLTDALTIDQLWVAWTEEVGDPQADELRKKKGTARAVIEKAVQQAQDKAQAATARIGLGPEAVDNTALNTLAMRLVDVMRFEEPAAEAFDDDDRDKVLRKIQSLAKQRPERSGMMARFMNRFVSAAGLGAAAVAREKPSSNELALGLLAMKAEAVYCEPSNLLEIPDVDNARAYVLGPPRDELLLKKDLPTKVRGGHAHEYQETYLSGQAATQAFALSPSLNVDEKLIALHDDLQHPFAPAFRRPVPNGQPLTNEEQDALDKAAKSTHRFLADHYFDITHDWRRIDGDWLATAEQLALNLDSDTNNTSLVLAFELGKPGAGSVLLFPGDAQVGNWLSWRDRSYKVGRKSMSADELLKRTLLYKVGHHGSHNATVKCDPRDETAKDGAPFGLELMEDIIAMVPVDRAAADKKMPTPWRMPHRPLYERLREKASRRVLRSDLSLKPLSAPEPEDLRPASEEWSQVPGKPGLMWRAARENFNEGTPGPIYYDIRIPIPMGK